MKVDERGWQHQRNECCVVPINCPCIWHLFSQLTGAIQTESLANVAVLRKATADRDVVLYSEETAESRPRQWHVDR